MAEPSPPRLLSIAGSDSGGGAGIQADLKAFARCGAHGMTAITAITAQNTVAVEEVIALPAGAILAQVRAVAADIGVDAIKIGMLGTVATIEEVEEALELLDELAGPMPLVVDPVMVAESGGVLLAEDAVEALALRILPRATVVTPNLAEARVLAGVAESAGSAATAVAPTPSGGEHEIESLATAVRSLGPRAVVVTGGHRDRLEDVFADAETVVAIPGERHPGGAAHGSGCTHSSALAAHLAHGLEPLEAARRARVIAGDAVRDGLRSIGAGPGPVDVLGVGRHGHIDTGAP